ncbi:MAG TPA: hypothetical protein VGR61_00085 [Candidatus Dormibacteraeota bacterium]|nr:hypothetical protein [Candidatus Dormibacteraeota bacterium]
MALLPPGMSTTVAAIYAGLGGLSVVALVIGVVLYGSAARNDTTQRLTSADKTMDQVLHDEARVGDKLKAAFEPEKGPESPTKTYNGNSVRQAIKDVQPDLDSAAKTVETDQSTMRTALTAINNRGLINLTSGDQLDHKAAQLEAVSRALEVRADEATTARQQLTLLGDLTTAQENFNGLAAALEKQDLLTATARYTPSNNAIKQTVADAQQSNTPDAVRNYVTEVSGFMDATQAVINSLQARDFGEYTASIRIFTTKLENLATYDPKTMRKQYDDLIKSYDDRYNSYIQDAGLVVGTKAV